MAMKWREVTPSSARYLILAALSLAVIIPVLSRGPLPQDQSYHRFADTRALAGIPNVLDVSTNITFIISGIAGLVAVIRLRKRRDSFARAGEALPYLVFFGGLCLIAAGSIHYHCAPSDGTLLWDRLAMTLSFMAFFTIFISERIGYRAAQRSFAPLVLLGIAGVIHWYLTETAGRGDLRLYALVQFYPMVIIPFAAALLPPRYTHGWVFPLAVGIYGAAKVLEVLDAEVFLALGETVSGHSLKHLVAGAAPLPLIWMMGRRKAHGEAPSISVI